MRSCADGTAFSVRARTASVVVAGLLLLAGCADSGDESPPQTTMPTDVTTTVKPVVGTVIPDGSPITIGSIAALSGPAAFLGEAGDAAIRAATLDYGPIAGFDVAVAEPIDGGCGDVEVVEPLELAIENHVLGFVGATCRSTDVEAARVIAPSDAVFVGASNTAPDLTAQAPGVAGANRRPGYYRTAPNAIEESLLAVRFLQEAAGVAASRPWAVLTDRADYADLLADVFVDASNGRGARLEIIGPDDAVAVADQLANQNFGAVFLPLVAPDTIAVVSAIRADARLDDVVIVVTDTALTDQTLAMPAFDGVHAITAGALDEAARSATGASVGEVRARLTESGIDVAGTFWANAYDATVLVLQAIEVAATPSDAGLIVDPGVVRAAMADTADLDGLTGALGCDVFGDCAADRLVVVTHRAGNSVAQTRAIPVYE